MNGRRQRTFLLAAALVVAAGAVLVVRWHASVARPAASPDAAAALIARQSDPPAPPSGDGRMTPALEQALRLEPGSVRTLGVYTTRRGGRFEVSRGRRAGGQECLVAVGYGGAGSSCGGLFAAGPVAILETASGGPGLQQRSDLEVVGLAQANVVRVAVVDSRGRTRRPALNENHSFLLEFDAAELHAGVGPAQLFAYDAAGAEVGRLDLSEPGR